MSNSRFIFLFILAAVMSLCATNVSADNCHDITKITVAIDRDYPPFEFINEDGKIDGFNYEVFDAVMHILNIPYEMVYFDDKEISLNELRSGHVDAVLGVAYSEEKAMYVRFSVPYYETGRCIVSRKSDHFKTIESLKGKAVAVLKGSWSEDFVLENNITDNVITLGSVDEGLSILAKGKYDAMISNDLTSVTQIRNRRLRNLTAVNIDMEHPIGHSIAVNPDNDAILELLNAGLLELKMSGQYDKIYNKWFYVYPLRNADRIMSLSIISTLLLVLVLTVIIVLFKVQVKRSVKKLKVSENLLENQVRESETVMQSLPVGVIIYSKEGILIEANNAAVRMFGLSKSMPFYPVNILESPNFPMFVKEAFLKGETIIRCDILYDFEKVKRTKYYPTDKSGTMQVCYDGVPVLNQQGTMDKYMVIMSDISSIHKQAVLLETMQQRLALAIESGNVSVWGYNIEHDKFYDIQGEIFINGPVSSQEAFDMVYPGDANALHDLFSKVIEGRLPKASVTVRFKNLKTGEYEYIQKDMMPVKENGKIKEIIGTHRNITQEVLLNNNKDMFLHSLNMAVKSANITAWYFDVTNNNIFVLRDNEYVTSNVTYSMLHDMVYPNERERFSSMFENIISGAKSSDIDVFRIKFSKNETYRYYEFSLTAVKNSSNELVTIAGTRKDVTDDYLWKNELEESQIKTNLAVNANDMALWEFDCSTKNINVTNAAIKPNHTVEEVLARIHPEDVESFRYYVDVLSGKKEEKISFDIRLRVKSNDEWRFISVVGVALKNNEGEVTKYVGIGRDNTKFVKLNNDLKYYIKQQDYVLKSCDLILWKYDIDSSTVVINFGASDDDQTLTLQEFTDSVHPDSFDIYSSSIEKMKNRAIDKFEYVIQRQIEDGKYKHCMINGVALRNDNGYIVGYTGVSKNLSEVVALNEKLARVQQRVLLINESNDIITWDYDVVRHLLHTYSPKAILPGQDMTPDTFLKYVHPNYKKKIIDLFDSMDKGEDVKCETNLKLMIPGSQSYSDVSMGCVSIKDDKGRIICYSGYRRDISKWIKLSEDLEDRNSQLKLALQAGRIHPFSWNAESNLIHFSTQDNVPLNTILLMPEWVSLDIMINELHPNDRERGQRLFDEVRAGKLKMIHDEARYNKRNGYKNHFEINMLVIDDENGNTVRAVGYFRDTTEQKRVYIELEEAKKIAEQSNKQKSTFLANMSHEIRTPLNAIVGFSELMKDTDDKEEKAMFWNLIDTNNELLLRLIGDILDLSKIESGMMEMRPERFDLAELYKELSVSLKQRVVNPDVEFFCDSPYSSCVIEFDKNRMAQVITNFATNSIKYTPHGFIRMGYIYENRGVRLYVSDSGIGVAEDKKNRLFQRFEKLDDFAQGTGLGLSICKAIAEINGGHVGFESTAGVGSTFWAWVPCEAAITVDNIVETTRVKELAQDVILDENGMSIKVLVADDIESNYLLVKSILKGCLLTRAVNGEDAVRLAKAERWSIILMDMKMPVMDGLEATREIRLFDTDTPIVAITANAFESDKIAAKEAGCNGFLTKPIRKADVINLINELNGKEKRLS